MRVLLITVRLRMDTPGGVTAAEASVREDNVIPIRTDTREVPHLPGTTVAGSLRAQWEARFDEASTKDLFGHIARPAGSTLRQSTGSDRPIRFPSKIQVLGTHYRGNPTLQPPDTTGNEEPHEKNANPVVHHRTAIDRSRGGPVKHSLHGVAMLPAGTEFDVVIRWNDPDPRQREQLLDILRTWHPRLGRGTALDAGRCRAVAYGSRDYDLSTPQGLHDWLRIRPDSELYPAPMHEIAHPASPQLAFNIECRIVDGLHCGTGEAVAPVDGRPRVNRVVERNGKYIVPASTLKGILRSRAEYICHAVGADVCEDQSCGRCTPCQIFGYSRNAATDSPHDNTPQAQRAKILIRDAIIEHAERRERQHVAIDRFTGGARPQLLYTDEVLVKGRFRIQIHEFRPLEDTERLLIDAVLTDLHDGLIGIGARTSSGLGTVRVTDPDLDIPANRPDLSSLAHRLAPESESTS